MKIIDPRPILALALFLVPACGSSDPRTLTNEGSVAFSSGRYEESAKSYEAALAAIGSDTAHPEWLRAKMGMIRAHTRTDASKAKQEFLELAKAAPSKVTDEDFGKIGSLLADARHFAEAREVLTEGKARYSESVSLDALLNDLGRRAEEGGDPAEADALRSLGYTGGK